LDDDGGLPALKPDGLALRSPSVATIFFEDKGPSGTHGSGPHVTSVMPLVETNRKEDVCSFRPAIGDPRVVDEALGIRIEHINDGGTRIIIVEKAWNGEIHDFLKTDNGERESSLQWV
jgi:hypothetical protein